MEHFIDIPKNFYSDGEGKPFENCLICGKDLLNGDVSYVVEKAMKNYDKYEFSSTVYEFAICTDCHQEQQNKMSEESIANMQLYYQEKVKEAGKQTVAIDLRNFDLKTWLSKCFFTDKPISEMQEYQIVAQFKGNKMLMNMPPMVIGEELGRGTGTPSDDPFSNPLTKKVSLPASSVTATCCQVSRVIAFSSDFP